MRLCVFEDARVGNLEPLTLTRPAFDLRCGAQTLLERLGRVLRPRELGAWVRPGLVALTREQHPELAVNEPLWLRTGGVVFVNGRWLPPRGTEIDPQRAGVGLVGEQIAYVVLSASEMPGERLDEWLASWKGRLPRQEVGGLILDYLWEAIDANAELLTADLAWFRTLHKPAPTTWSVIGPAEHVVVASEAEVEPNVVFDTRKGPVLIDRGALVQAFSRLEGPCYVGTGSCVMAGTKLRGGTLGPHCRIGGEVEASILLGYANKYHDGFLGHSYLGAWVNLAAGTQTSDLRNDYGEVRVQVAGHRVGTGRSKVGSFIGDHSKTGLGALLNTGSSLGAFAQVLPSGSLLPHVIPSFCQLHAGLLHEQWDLRKLFGTAATVMRRRGVELTETQTECYHALYEATADPRRRAVRETEARRLRN